MHEEAPIRFMGLYYTVDASTPMLCLNCLRTRVIGARARVMQTVKDLFSVDSPRPSCIGLACDA